MMASDESLQASSFEEQADESMDISTMDTSSPNPEDNTNSTGSNAQSKKRSASTSEPNGAAKITKRRAARACISCRSRKVRCDVVEGAPCGNCRWDNVECIVQESRRRR